MTWCDSTTEATDTNLSKLQETEEERRLVCHSPWGCRESDMTKSLDSNSSRKPERVLEQWGGWILRQRCSV